MLPPPRATNFHVAESRRYFYFFATKKFDAQAVGILETNNRNMQCNIVARQVERNCCRITWPLLKVLPQ